MRNQDLSFEAWRDKIIAELDAMQQELRAKMVPHAHNSVGEASSARPVRSVQFQPVQQTSQHGNRMPVVEKKKPKERVSKPTGQVVKLPGVAVPVKKVHPKQFASRAEPARSPLPPIVQTRSSFWQKQNSPALEAYRQLSDEKRQIKAAQMQAEYDAECARLGM